MAMHTIWADVKAKLLRVPSQMGNLSVIPAFALFNAILILGVGGTLHYLRSSTDDYSAVAMNFLNVGLVTIMFVASFAALAALYLSAKTKTGLKNVGAIIVTVALLEILGLGFMTNRTFTFIPRSHRAEEIASIQEYISNETGKLPQKINDDITLDKMFFRRTAIYMIYDLKDKPGYGYDESAMRKELRGKACQWFRDYAQYKTIENLTHIFVMGKAVKYHFTFHRKDCLGAESAPQQEPFSSGTPVHSPPPTSSPATESHP